MPEELPQYPRAQEVVHAYTTVPVLLKDEDRLGGLVSRDVRAG